MTAAAKTNGRARVAPVTAAAARIPGLDEALLAFQAEAPKLRRDAIGQIQHRTYGYVTLDSLLDDVAPLLLKHELLWKTRPTTDEHGRPALRYSMTHVPSGESDEDVVALPMVSPDPQAFGSATTYMRRYALQAYLNLAPGDDDDGAAASRQNGGQNAEQNAEPDTNVRQPTAAAPKPSERPASAPQRKMLRAKAAQAGLSPERFANLLLAAAEGEPCDWADEAAAQRWIDRNLDRFPARCVTAAKAALEEAAKAAGEGGR